MSLAPTYGCFGCVAFAHNQRTSTYVMWACRNGRFTGDPSGVVRYLRSYCSCPADDEEFVDPITDQVCWYDPLVPESADFLGIVITGSSGIRSSSYKREVFDGLNGGTILGEPFITGKQIVLEIAIIATSDAGMNYGIQWLRRQFEDDQRCPADGTTCASCQGQMFTLRVHCAESEDALDTGLHSWSAAGTIDGFMLAEDNFPLGRANCEKVRTGTLTIATESFDSYSTEPVDTAEVTIAEAFTALGSCPCLSELPTLDDVCCPICATGCDPCTTDPGCDCLPPFVLEPAVIGGSSPCFAEPPCRCITALAVNDLPAGYESALRLTLQAGWDAANPIFQKYGARNIVIRVYENADGFAVPTESGTCDEPLEFEEFTRRVGPCAEVGVSWMPAGSQLVIDGLSGKTWLKCNGECVDHSARVHVISGSISPLKVRCTDLIVTIEWDCLNAQGDDSEGKVLSGTTIETFLGFKL